MESFGPFAYCSWTPELHDLYQVRLSAIVCTRRYAPYRAAPHAYRACLISQSASQAQSLATGDSNPQAAKTESISTSKQQHGLPFTLATIDPNTSAIDVSRTKKRYGHAVDPPQYEPLYEAIAILAFRLVTVAVRMPASARCPPYGGAMGRMGNPRLFHLRSLGPITVDAYLNRSFIRWLSAVPLPLRTPKTAGSWFVWELAPS
ncbi:hypothetical protein BO70DRAFT_392440 [Aspergillus heteromorphus CBS 117.55]|uniref:Uncharacterized protein n=1 Tax=Aspergillus heteromorphus CBS 117.55 TaxID=1448321 RepID=A0A317WZP9_9EURO|nr:uncharacterized protein BO70DRAFT_392440 [Aspergillus heteromorphus CBS 117.55]PWY90757.1 hypothetical protein BO70DRAFT_392440 [Aspergillus heteromorphus CBS 117.55]